MKFWTPAVKFEGKITVPSRGLTYHRGVKLDEQIAVGEVVTEPVNIPPNTDREGWRVPYADPPSTDEIFNPSPYGPTIRIATFRRMHGAIAEECPAYGARVDVVEGWERTE